MSALLEEDKQIINFYDPQKGKLQIKIPVDENGIVLKHNRKKNVSYYMCDKRLVFDINNSCRIIASKYKENKSCYPNQYWFVVVYSGKYYAMSIKQRKLTEYENYFVGDKITELNVANDKDATKQINIFTKKYNSKLMKYKYMDGQVFKMYYCHYKQESIERKLAPFEDSDLIRSLNMIIDNHIYYWENITKNLPPELNSLNDIQISDYYHYTKNGNLNKDMFSHIVFEESGKKYTRSEYNQQIIEHKLNYQLSHVPYYQHSLDFQIYYDFVMVDKVERKIDKLKYNIVEYKNKIKSILVDKLIPDLVNIIMDYTIQIPTKDELNERRQIKFERAAKHKLEFYQDNNQEITHNLHGVKIGDRDIAMQY
jgi:hypothetical protein